MLENYDVTSIEQAKVLAHPLRIDILSLFNDDVPRTAKQLADMLQLPSGKVHYHVQELFRVGLLQLVETKMKGGIVEKYYLPIAKKFRVFLKEGEDGSDPTAAATLTIIGNMLDEYKRTFMEAAERSEQQKEDAEGKLKPVTPIMKFYRLLLKEQELQQLTAELEEVIDRWKELSASRKGMTSDDVKTFRFMLSHHEQNIQGGATSKIKYE